MILLKGSGLAKKTYQFWQEVGGLTKKQRGFIERCKFNQVNILVLFRDKDLAKKR